jgi:cell filamentation protein
MYDAIDDPYTYENSTVLKNRLDLRAQAELDAFEAEISSARAEEPLPEGALDFAHSRAVHHHLFQDVYEWAPGEMLEAMIASFGGDEKTLVAIIERLVG